MLGWKLEYVQFWVNTVYYPWCSYFCGQATDVVSVPSMPISYNQQNTRFLGQAFQGNAAGLGIADYLWAEVCSSYVATLEKP